jgi:ligand-binding sensor domain-containing protein/two-component sensor histidine kinase
LRNKLLNIIIFLFTSILHIAQNVSLDNSTYSFKQIGVERGLSQSSILSITQDNRGYLWFGTATGLNRYDGYEFIVYSNDASDSLSISDNEITSLLVDSEGNLWIGTSTGVLNKFDPLTETFSHFDLAGSSDWSSSTEDEVYNIPITFSRNQISTITTIDQDRDGNLWVGTWGKGVVRFNPKSNKKKYFYHFQDRENSLSSNRIVKVLVDIDNIIWVGTFGGGLNRISPDSTDQSRVVIEQLKVNSAFLFGERISALYQDSRNDIWIGDYNGNISVIDNTSLYKKPSLLKIKIINSSLNVSSNNKLKVMDIIEDQNSIIWIATNGDGLFNYSLTNGTSNQFLNEKSNQYSLSENELQRLFVDKSGILWIGTQLGSGINKLERRYNKFKTLPVKTEVNKSLNDNIIWAIHEDKEEDLWFGTHRGGLNKWNKRTNEFSYIRKKIIGDDHIRSIVEDKMGNLWIGTYAGGLTFYNKEYKSFRNFRKVNNNTNSLTSNQIQSLLIDGDTTLWIGTFGGGLNKLDLKGFYRSGSAQFKSFIHNPSVFTSLSDNRIYVLYQDKDKNLWVGTHGGGLNKFDKQNETFTVYKSIPNKKNLLFDNKIMSLHETEDQKLLIGTFGGGLNLFDYKLNKNERMSEKISLNCSDVYGILFDDQSGYWLSTDKGIYNLDKSLKSFRHYDLSDGLQSLEFSGGAYEKGKDGTFYFGGINGVNFFNPQNIQLDKFLPPIVISRIKVFDEPIKGEKQKLVFGRDENYFSFEFASLDYKNSDKNKYQFILEGLDTKWSFTDSKDRRVFYTNLAPGDYTFRVRGTNNDGIWSPNEAKVNITILAPFWMQWWFIGGLILFIGGVSTFFINQRIRYLLALDKLKSNIAADLHDNIGAGLTEISILSELSANIVDKSNNATKHLKQISELSRHLTESMSDIVWVVNPKRDSLYDLIVRLKDSYGELLADLGIKLETSDLDKLSDIKLPMDYRQNLYLILKESLNNAIKHSNCSKIDLIIKIFRNKLYIIVSDNGIGFDTNKTANGNGITNIKDRGNKINGNIKIISEINKGTKIEFRGNLK